MSLLIRKELIYAVKILNVLEIDIAVCGVSAPVTVDVIILKISHLIKEE